MDVIELQDGQKKKAGISWRDPALGGSYIAVICYRAARSLTFARYAGMSRIDEMEMEEMQTHDSNPFLSNRILLAMILTRYVGVEVVL